ncbi:MAG: hypothetical protein AAF666_13435 [Pseudomonadota bacterium]
MPSRSVPITVLKAGVTVVFAGLGTWLARMTIIVFDLVSDEALREFLVSSFIAALIGAMVNRSMNRLRPTAMMYLHPHAVSAGTLFWPAFVFLLVMTAINSTPPTIVFVLILYFAALEERMAARYLNSYNASLITYSVLFLMLLGANMLGALATQHVNPTVNAMSWLCVLGCLGLSARTTLHRRGRGFLNATKRQSPSADGFVIALMLRFSPDGALKLYTAFQPVVSLSSAVLLRLATVGLHRNAGKTAWAGRILMLLCLASCVYFGIVIGTILHVPYTEAAAAGLLLLIRFLYTAASNFFALEQLTRLWKIFLATVLASLAVAVIASVWQDIGPFAPLMIIAILMIMFLTLRSRLAR